MFLTSLKKWLFSTLTLKMNVGSVRFLGMGFVGQFDDCNRVKQSFFFFFSFPNLSSFPFSYLISYPVIRETFKNTGLQKGI